MLISQEYRALNKDLHESDPHYGTSGAKFAPRIEAIAKTIGAITILDYGCGKQLLGKALSHLLIKGYDPALEGLNGVPEPVDFVVCGDVLEHIEPDYLEAVLDDLLRCTLKGIFLTVCCVPALKVLSDGRNAHLIQKPIDWWLPQIMRRWDLQSVDATPIDFSLFALKKGFWPE